jgi:REP-associated tyrosine transposase
VTSYRRSAVPGGSFFFTVNLDDRRTGLLTEHIDLLRAAFRSVRVQHPFTVKAAVILPDHLHTIWTLPKGDADFALRWRLIKSVFSHALPRTEAISDSEAARASAVSGSGAIGSIRSAINRISIGTSITSISIP